MKVTVIAEAGVNHNGDLGLARKLIDVAADAGADFVKFQTFNAANLVTSYAKKAQYQSISTGEGSQLDMLQELELSATAHEVLIRHCTSRGIKFLSTGFDIDSIDLLNAYGVEYLKIPSGEITNLHYLRHIGALNKPTILSTGMANMVEIAAAVEVLTEGGLKRDDLTILHCNTIYPTPVNEVNLNAMLSIRHRFKTKVGFSDHTEGVEVAIAAVALGATVIEKHFTLDRRLPGPDHKASLEPKGLKELVRSIRNVERAMGSDVKEASPGELENKAIARKSIVASCHIRKGEMFTSLNLAVKRPGCGISPMLWDKVIGHEAPRDFLFDELIEL